MPMIKDALFAILLLSLLVDGRPLNMPSTAATPFDSQDTVLAIVSDGILKKGGDFATYILPVQAAQDTGPVESSQPYSAGDSPSGLVIRWFHHVQVELDDGKPILRLTISAQIAKDASGNTVPDHDPVVIAKIVPQPLFGIPEQPPPMPAVQDLIHSENVPKDQLGVDINGKHMDYATLAANTYNIIITRDRLPLPLMRIQEAGNKLPFPANPSIFPFTARRIK
jgi:hypothetical protein